MGPVKLPQAAAPELDFSIICASSSFIFRAEGGVALLQAQLLHHRLLEEGRWGMVPTCPEQGRSGGLEVAVAVFERTVRKRRIFFDQLLNRAAAETC
jgi:hypothetical protein